MFDDHKPVLSDAEIDRILKGENNRSWWWTVAALVVFSITLALLLKGCDAQPRQHIVTPAPIVYDAPLAPAPVVVQQHGLDVGDVLLMNALMNSGNSHTREVHYVDRPVSVPASVPSRVTAPPVARSLPTPSAAERVTFRPQPAAAPSAAQRVQFKPPPSKPAASSSSASRVSFSGSKTK